MSSKLSLEDVTKYFQAKTPWAWVNKGQKLKAWEFEVTDPETRETTILIPFNPTIQQCDDAVKSLRLYFDFFKGRYAKTKEL